MTKDDFQKIAKNIPHKPGVYRYLDKQGTPIYIGKAKNLKHRLSSYFAGQSNNSNKTKVMLKNADHIEYTVVNTDNDAYILENTLIKKHQPRYNVMLKDGKSYVYLRITNERFPRVFFTRKVIRDGSTYFGPYTSKYRVNILLEIIKELFPIRTCTFSLTEQNIQKQKFKPCLEYHINNCKAPCIGNQSEEEYNDMIDQVKNILKGNFKPVKDHLHAEMEYYSEKLDFEKAQQIKDKMIAFDDYQAKSVVSSPVLKDVDVFSVQITENYGYYNYLKVVNGNLINSHSDQVKLQTDLSPEQLLEDIIPQIRDKFDSVAKEVIIDREFDMFVHPEYTVTVPKIGEKKKILDLSKKNLMYHRVYHQRLQHSKSNRKGRSERILKTMQTDLNLEKPPFHIECFDNSNIQGSDPVASCVVFKNAKPSKRDYRHFKIKTVEGPDDFASMREIVYRRYKRMWEEEGSMPDLIIIDGGKGQLSSAVKVLEDLDLLNKTNVIGIAKKLEEIYFPGDPIPLHINKKSETLKVIQQARNEAHRFAITFHRDLRSKRVNRTSLTEINGVGEKTSQKLLTHFQSVQRVKDASIEEIEAIIGPALAKKVVKGLNQMEEEE